MEIGELIADVYEACLLVCSPELASVATVLIIAGIRSSKVAQA